MRADAGLRDLVGYRMKRAFAVIQADLSRVLEPFGLRMIPFSALVVIARQPGIGQGQLAAALAVERSNLVAPLDGLEARGLIRREAVPGDRRALALKPTPAGLTLAEAALAAVRAHEARLMAGVSEADVAALFRACAAIETVPEREETSG
ncbi:MAG: MarR family transcriptional regulator [Rhodobacteraceae bacterium]|nr:MarR family transcriptional regulator [Paracoccaceae bacterium]